MNYKKINQYMSNKQIDKLYPQLNYMKFFFVRYMLCHTLLLLGYVAR